MARDLRKQMSTYMTGKGKNNIQKGLIAPVFFDGIVNPQNLTMMGAIARGDIEMTRLIVAGHQDSVGVNFWPQC